MKLTHKVKQQRGFTLLELMVVITIIAILASASYPVLTKSIAKARMRKDAAHVDQIVKACKLYAMDWDGIYPSTDTSSSGDSSGGGASGGSSGEFGNSTDAFNELIREVDLGTEEIFFVQGNPEKLLPPNQDGELVAEENCYSYVVGQSDSTPARSPLVADEMSGGSYTENHPWLKSGRAIVGYCGGQVKIEKLTSKEEGATVRGAPGSGIEDVFQKATEDEEGRITGGLLAVEPDKLVDPE